VEVISFWVVGLNICDCNQAEISFFAIAVSKDINDAHSTSKMCRMKMEEILN
jgi:hypothetical protein